MRQVLLINRFVRSPFIHITVLWNASGECQNTQVIKGHTGCILELQWARDGASIFTASTDKTCGQFDVETGARVKKFKGHTGIINTCSVTRRGSELLASGADEGHVKIWDPRQKLAIKSLNAQLPVLAVSFSLDGGLLFSSGIDGEIKVFLFANSFNQAWDLRKDTVSYSMSGHTDTVTGLRLSPDGDALLSYSMDNTARIWDVKPFAVTGSRLQKTFEGAPHGYEKNVIRPCWSPDSDFIATGCGDRSVMIWNASTGRIAYKLPGHKGCVNQVDWTGTILASGSSDRNIFVGELNLNEVK